jgi:hypothetical protein
MTRTYTGVALYFAFMEFCNVYLQYFDVEAKLFTEESQCPGAFKGWKMAFNNTELAPAQRQIEYYAIWASNANITMTLLMMLSGMSSESKIRLSATLIMITGCLIYFVRMERQLRYMDEVGDVRSGLGTQDLQTMFSVLFLWVAAFLAELHTALKGRADSAGNDSKPLF